jgi:sugar (pentulose or hexulose) kinase
MPTRPDGLRAAPATEIRHLEPTSPEETYVLAVDLGTGGPKVALLSATGRIAAHAFQAVGVDLTDDGGAEQSPGAWWEAVVSSARRALADIGVAPEQVVGIGCTSQWLGTVPVDGAGDAIGPAIIWMDSRGASAIRDVVRGTLNVQGYSPTKLASWVRRTGGVPSLSGKDPVGHIHFLRRHRPRRPCSWSRSTTSTCASPGWPGRHTTRSPGTGSPTTGTSGRSHMTTA